jgi:hypothetical protein
MFLEVLFDVRNDQVCAFHDVSAHHDDFWIVGVNQAHSVRRPDIEAPVPQ